ncbi:hypothetical protein Tco_0229335, partial [Tanacetum coccineum]
MMELILDVVEDRLDDDWFTGTVTDEDDLDGMKVGDMMSRAQAWKEVVDKVKNRLSKWKMKALSIG